MSIYCLLLLCFRLGNCGMVCIPLYSYSCCKLLFISIIGTVSLIVAYRIYLFMSQIVINVLQLTCILV